MSHNCKFTPLVTIRTDEHTELKFEEIELRTARRDGTSADDTDPASLATTEVPVTVETSLALAMADGNDYSKLFSFHSPHEAIAFFERCLEQARRYVE